MAAVEEHGCVETMRRVLSYLTAERRRLHARGADDVELEANRLAIAAMEWHLERALAEEDARVREPQLP
jgi:hypothetical protein